MLECRWEFPCPSSADAIVLRTIQQHGLKRVNLAHKSKHDDLVQAVRTLRAACTQLDVCAHYAINANYGGSAVAAFEAVQATLAGLATAGASSVLLVSGGGERRKLDSLGVLCKLAETSLAQRGGGGKAARRPRGGAPGGPQCRPSLAPRGAAQPESLPPLCIAFNPYLPPGGGQEGERSRLRAKLQAGLRAGLLAGVYLQAGGDVAALDAGLVFLQQALAEAAAEAPDPRGGQIQVCGSVLVPSPQLLASLRFRPWRGVLLGQRYLSGVEAAEEVLLEVLHVYRRHGVVPLVEPGVASVEALQRAQRLLQAAGL